MTATAVDRLATNHPQDDRLSRGFPAASTTLYAGAMIAVNASGYIVNASASDLLKVIGTADEGCVSGTTAGQDADGNALEVRIRRGVQGPFANSGSADAITDAHRGQRCYAQDNQTVALTSNGGARPLAGIVDRVTSAGVYVNFSASGADDLSGTYTPTITVSGNTTASSVPVGWFTRIGNLVMFTVRVSVTHTAGAPTVSTIDVSLPIASAFDAAADAGGTVSGVATITGAVTANQTDNRLTLSYVNTGTGALVVQATGHYLVK